MNECITSKKKPSKLHKGQHFFGFQLAGAAPVLEAGGKPSTRFPPEGLAELTCHARSMRMSSYGFLLIKWEISKNHENVTFSRFCRKLSGAQTLTLHYEIDN